MIDDSRIIVLLGQILGLRGKRESYDAKGISLTSGIISQITMARMFENEFRTWCSNFRIQ